MIGFIVTGHSQHVFNGHIDTERWQNDIYLSVIDDYRTIKSINDEQIISKVSADSSGFFEFRGDQLDPTPRIYKLHVDNCTSTTQIENHFDGHCADSQDIIFIAKSNDTITFPLSFDAQMFCDIISSNPRTAAFIKVDSIKEEMKFAYSEYRSKANRELNNKKWFKRLQDYGESLDEPLAELYIYSFLSDRSNSIHEYYLEDVVTNSYYDELRDRLQKRYPNSSYTRQYEAELNSDKLIANPKIKTGAFNWYYVIIPVLILSLILNFLLFQKSKNTSKKFHDTAKAQLTKQEQNVLELLLQEKSNKDIAEALFVSVSTIKTHVNNIYKKLNVNSREEINTLFNK
ncbi:MAG: response regulator transcription factor [Psychroserpens sp.]|nr:response regulator transcription factor [Psychroserpens sp.]MBO6631801.1 response regulator transcription factor [Psychroserpens sp.]MBO6654863.1 response regulator transcription factor [Psychroserpens sp.]MBO6683063.1 response regulator transcription factor [Psychroserpens sp.]MBO6751368.1 response regulator transcription factor [Psychroserpens sp.]